MIYITLGPDAAMCRSETFRLVAEHDPSGSNTTRLDGKTLRLADAISMVGTPAFFGGSRVIVIDDLLARQSKGVDGSDVESDTSAPKSSKNGLDLKQLFDSVNGDNVLILSDPSLQSVPAAVLKALPKGSKVIQGEPPRGQALLAWIEDHAKTNGNTIEREAARLLADMLFPQTWISKPSNPRYDRPPDLDLIANEVAKLALYAYPEPISIAHVQELTGSAMADRLFSFVEQSVAGNLANAVKDLESFDIHGDDAHRASNQLYQQIELSTALASAQATDPAVVGRDLGLSNPQRMFGVARAPRPRDLVKGVLDALSTDRDVKAGRLKGVDDAIYRLIADFAEVRAQTQERRDRS